MKIFKDTTKGRTTTEQEIPQVRQVSSFWACREKGWPRVPDAVRCSRENRRTPFFTHPGKESKQKK